MEPIVVNTAEKRGHTASGQSLPGAKKRPRKPKSSKPDGSNETIYPAARPGVTSGSLDRHFEDLNDLPKSPPNHWEAASTDEIVTTARA